MSLCRKCEPGFTKPNVKPCRGWARPNEVVYATWAERVRRTAIGYSRLPEVVCCKSCFGSESSKGNLPQTIVYKTTPRLQTSLAIPSYGIPIRQQRVPIKNWNSWNWKVLNRGVLHFNNLASRSHLGVLCMLSFCYVSRTDSPTRTRSMTSQSRPLCTHLEVSQVQHKNMNHRMLYFVFSDPLRFQCSVQNQSR